MRTRCAFVDLREVCTYYGVTINRKNVLSVLFKVKSISDTFIHLLIDRQQNRIQSDGYYQYKSKQTCKSHQTKLYNRMT